MQTTTWWAASVFSRTLSRCSCRPPPIDRPTSGSAVFASSSSRCRKPSSTQARATIRAAPAGDEPGQEGLERAVELGRVDDALALQEGLEAAHLAGEGAVVVVVAHAVPPAFGVGRGSVGTGSSRDSQTSTVTKWSPLAEQLARGEAHGVDGLRSRPAVPAPAGPRAGAGRRRRPPCPRHLGRSAAGGCGAAGRPAWCGRRHPERSAPSTSSAVSTPFSTHSVRTAWNHFS